MRNSIADIGHPDDIAFLVLATIDALGEATAFAIYQTHAEQESLCTITPSLTLPTVHHALWRLRDTGMIDVSRSITTPSYDGKTITVRYYGVTDLGKLALKHRGRREEGRAA
jgi:DNA-binding transcriptional ArsR family regulator